MKLLTRTAFVFLTALALVAAAYAGHSKTDITYAVTGGNIYFDKSSGTVTDCDGSVTEAVIPAQIDGVAIVTIGEQAFSHCSGLTSVKIPDSVTSIRDYAFYGCSGLTSVEIPDSVTSIGDSAFAVCSNLTSVEIPNSVTSIGEGAFGSCTSLANIHVASGNQQYVSVDGVLFNKSQTTLIGYPAGKTGAYQIPNSVTSIRNFAFQGYSGLTSVEIPNSITSIGEGAFGSCTSLANIHVASGNQQYVSVDGVLFNKSQTTLIGYPAGKTGAYQIPNSVTSIRNFAFQGYSGLTSVEIPNNVTSIGFYAFYDCGSLRDVYYTGSKEQWEAIEEINDSKLISGKITIHYNASMPSAPEFTIPSAPTVNGDAVSKADLSGLTEISVPLAISSPSAVTLSVCVPFFDGAKVIGMGYVAATADKRTTSVTVPVMGDLSGAGKLKVILLDADFRPLAAAPFDLAA